MKRLKKQSRILKILFATSLSLSSCAYVVVKDGEVCGDMGKHGATCQHTFTNENRDITKDKWDSFRVGKMCMDSDLFSNWKSTIIKLCDKYRCRFETLDKDDKVDLINMKF